MKNPFKLLTMVLAIVLIFTSVGLPVGAQEGIEGGTTTTGEGETPQGAGTNSAVPGGPGFIMVHPVAFLPLDSYEQRGIGSGGVLYNPTPEGAYYHIDVNLPHRATINKIVLYYFDNTIATIEVLMARSSPEDSTSSIVGSLSSEGENLFPSVYETTSLTYNVVDNQRYGYFLQVYLPGGYGSDLNIGGIRIDYSYPVNLPLINK